MQRIVPVPDLPRHVRGVINLRSRVIPVMDVRQRFGMEPRDYSDRTMIVLVEVQGSSVGLIVDAVRGIVELPPGEAEQADGSSGNVVERLVHTSRGVSVLLDVERLVFSPSRTATPTPIEASSP
jgi:purine-binding chemotaxis protein CheW